MPTPCPFSPAPRAPAALVRIRCWLTLGLAKVTGAASAGIDGGLTGRLLSMATVGVNDGAYAAGGGGTGGGVGRTLALPPPPQAASANAIAHGNSARVAARADESTVFIALPLAGGGRPRHPPVPHPLRSVVNGLAPARNAAFLNADTACRGAACTPLSRHNPGIPARPAKQHGVET